MQVFGCFLFVYMRFFYYLCPRFWSLEINYTLSLRVLYGSARPVPPLPVASAFCRALPVLPIVYLIGLVYLVCLVNLKI